MKLFGQPLNCAGCFDNLEEGSAKKTGELWTCTAQSENGKWRGKNGARRVEFTVWGMKIFLIHWDTGLRSLAPSFRWRSGSSSARSSRKSSVDGKGRWQGHRGERWEIAAHICWERLLLLTSSCMI